ncbi:MAG: SpoIIE family protein phosphatase, partial [Bacteroidota bacterium]
GGPLLGVVPGAVFQTGEVELATGDLLVLYSDGITEAENEAAEEFDIPGLDAALQSGPRGDAGNALDALVDAVTRFADCAPTEADDLTLVAVRVMGDE